MRDSPFAAAGEAEELLARHQEEASSAEADMRSVAVLGAREHLKGFGPMRVGVVKPSSGRARIVPSIPLPLRVEPQVARNRGQQIHAWHQSAREEMAPHPVACPFFFEGVSQLAVAEHVNEEPTVRS